MTTTPPDHRDDLLIAESTDPLHKLRNLVGSSLLTLEALLRLAGDLPPEVRGDLERVVKQLREAGNVVRRLPEDELEARIDRGGVPTRTSRCDARDRLRAPSLI